MPDMYDKLGEMLNEALESGRIPQQNSNNGQNIPEEECEDSDRFSFNQAENQQDNSKKYQKTKEKDQKSAEKLRKKQIPVGQVIKLHKYTYNMQFPSRIQKALSTLDIVYPFTQKDITKQYHKLLKENHPDTQKAIQTSQTVHNTRQYTIDEITESYKILCDFFGIK